MLALKFPRNDEPILVPSWSTFINVRLVLFVCVVSLSVQARTSDWVAWCETVFLFLLSSLGSHVITSVDRTWSRLGYNYDHLGTSKYIYPSGDAALLLPVASRLFLLCTMLSAGFKVVKDDFIKSSGEDRLRNFNALGEVADGITQEAHLLCFDEFQVTWHSFYLLFEWQTFSLCFWQVSFDMLCVSEQDTVHAGLISEVCLWRDILS